MNAGDERATVRKGCVVVACLILASWIVIGAAVMLAINTVRG